MGGVLFGSGGWVGDGEGYLRFWFFWLQRSPLQPFWLCYAWML